MIIGKVKDLDQYRGLSKNIDTAIDYILRNDLTSIEDGKYTLSDGVKLIADSYQPRDLELCYLEGHRNCLDLQLVVSGYEGFGYADITSVETSGEYNAEKDMQKYQGECECVYQMSDLSFALVYPEDIHMPKIKLEESNVKKLVFKIEVGE